MTDVPRFDVFVAYAGPDRAWVRVLAGRLRDAGFGVFFDEWVILPGDVVTRRQEDGIQAAEAGVVVCSPRAVSSPRVSTVLDEQSVRDLTALLDQAEESEQEDQPT